ncbi:unnamed protein product [Paramecium sonneborni]|uniref:Uncharacterized protein n=1 Tax=Paramecium sonneborni TaxID=65129 RepID=A0A8S1K762_9CILI|nr:unnamed protein product [Paramecium sonneborni]
MNELYLLLLVTLQILLFRIIFKSNIKKSLQIKLIIIMDYIIQKIEQVQIISSQKIKDQIEYKLQFFVLKFQSLISNLNSNKLKESPDQIFDKIIIHIHIYIFIYFYKDESQDLQQFLLYCIKNTQVNGQITQKQYLYLILSNDYRMIPQNPI